VTTSTLSSNPRHWVAARRILHSGPNVPFLLKTRWFADSDVHVRRLGTQLLSLIVAISKSIFERGIRNRMAQQSSNGNRPKLSEKGLLTPDNCVVALIDHQGQMLFGTSNFDRQGIINNTVAFGKAARVFDVSVVLSTVETKSFSGNMWPQLRAVFPGQEPIERSTMNSWDDKNFVAAIEKSGRKKILIAGLWTETCVALPTVQALHDGYEVYVVEDCCGDVSQLAHDNAMKRVIQAGAKPVTSLSVMLEWQRDWAHKGTYDAVMDIVKNHYGAYGIGVEYAYTMVHGAPATKFTEYAVPVAVAAHK
jgi:nicotinamidase-related amidase